MLLRMIWLVRWADEDWPKPDAGSSGLIRLYSIGKLLAQRLSATMRASARVRRPCCAADVIAIERQDASVHYEATSWIWAAALTGELYVNMMNTAMHHRVTIRSIAKAMHLFTSLTSLFAKASSGQRTTNAWQMLGELFKSCPG